MRKAYNHFTFELRIIFRKMSLYFTPPDSHPSAIRRWRWWWRRRWMAVLGMFRSDESSKNSIPENVFPPFHPSCDAQWQLIWFNANFVELLSRIREHSKDLKFNETFLKYFWKNRVKKIAPSSVSSLTAFRPCSNRPVCSSVVVLLCRCVIPP